MIKVLFLPRWYPHVYDPMPGLFIKRQAEAVSAFCDVAVLYVHPDEKAANKYEIVVSKENEVHTVRIYYRLPRSTRSFPGNMINHFRFLRGYQKGFRILREFRPDLLHVHSLTRHGFIAMVYRLLTGTPYVVTEHWSRYLPGNSAYKGFFRKLITKCVVRRAAGMAAVSQTLQKAMQNQGLENRRFRVIANPVDTGRFRILDENRKKTEPVKRIIHISCFDEKSKNISGFLRILKKISADRNDFVCHLVGTGPDLEKMKQYAGELSIPEKTVVFTGLIEGDALVKEINDSDFLVLSSNFETFGTVVAESLSCGIPVLATRVGIVPGVVNNDNGMITEPGNEGEMEAAMRLMLQECRNFDRDKVRKSVSGLFSMERIGKDLMDLYSEALNKQNRTTL